LRKTCKHMLSRWNPPSGTVEMATVTGTGVPVLFKMRCMFFFTVKTCLCALSEESTRSFLPFLPLIFKCEIYMPCLVRLSLRFFLNGTINSDILFRMLWAIFGLAKTSNKPIGLTTWLAVNPRCLSNFKCYEDAGAFYFNKISAADVKSILLKQTYKLRLFLSETSDIFVWLP